MPDALVYSTENPCAIVNQLLAKHGNDRDAALMGLFTKSCSNKAARELAVAFAACFGLSQAEFFREFQRLHGVNIA